MRRSATWFLLTVAMCAGCGSGSESDRLTERWKDESSVTRSADGSTTERQQVFAALLRDDVLRGKSAPEVRDMLGDPMRVEQGPDGEGWVYPVAAAPDGRCVDAVYLDIQNNRVAALATNEPCDSP